MTKIYLDTANLEEIREITPWGILSGITTNQKIFLNEKGCNFEQRAKEILSLANLEDWPVSLEGPNNYEGILEAALKYSSWGENVVIKVPMLGNGDGLRAVRKLRISGIKTNVTACMTVNQAFLAASAGATYVSLFYNRIKDFAVANGAQDDGTEEAVNILCDTMEMLDELGNTTQLIVGSIRSPKDIEHILLANPDIITIPTKILKQMAFCDKTEEALLEFEKAWEEFCAAEAQE